MSSGEDCNDGGSVNGEHGELLEDREVPCQQDGKDGHNLKCCGHLAQKTRVDLRMIINEKHDKETYQNDDIPGDDDDHQPAGNNFNDGEGNESSGDKEFVSNGIEVSTQFGPLVRQTCNEAVNPICNPCNRKSDKRPFEVFVDDENDEEWNQKNSC